MFMYWASQASPIYIITFTFTMFYMKKNKLSSIYSLKYVLFVGLVMGSLSCGNRIDLEPTQLVTENVAFVTFNDYRAALIGAYTPLRPMYQAYVRATDRTGDDVKVGVNNLGQGAFLYNLNAPSSEGDFATIWDNGYSAINRANGVISKIPALQANTAADVTEKNRILGEALAIRGMVHFDMLRVFASRFQGNGGGLGIPYITEVLKPSAKPSRNTIQEVLDNVLADLNAAEGLVTANFTATNRIFITKPAVLALKARYYLYKGEFANALAAANAAITATTAAPNSIALSTGTTYRDIWSDVSFGEVIFKIKFVQGQGSLGGDYWGEQNDTNFFTPTVDLLSLYGSNDTRSTNFFGTAASGNTVIKHRGPAPTPSTDFGRSDIKWLRLSELYLIRAEASIETGDEATAKTAIHDIRTARITGYDRNNASNVDATTLNSTSGNALRELLRTERRKELCFEGHRFLDLKRQNLNMVRIDCNASPSSSCSLTAGANRFTYAIPQGEVSANSNMVQNPGY